jgi:hypothetical protein
MSNLAERLACERAWAPIHPAIDHALAPFAPAIAARAAVAIGCALGARIRSADAQAWAGSRLTGDGFPFELGFSTADDRLRFTIEPGGAELPPRERLALAAEVSRLLGDEAVPAQVMQGLQAMQSEGPLAYGAWIGCRAGGGRFACKLYVEVPRGAPLRAGRMALADREPTLRIIAYTPSTGAFEAYCRVRSLEPRHLPAVLALAQGEGRAGRLLEFLEEIYGYSIRGRLPGPSVGVSYLPGAAGDRVTLYFYARAIWGSDAAIRRGFPRVARAYGWDDDAYLRVTAPIAEREDWRTYHGLFGVTLEASGRMALSIGVRPVAP